MTSSKKQNNHYSMEDLIPYKTHRHNNQDSDSSDDDPHHNYKSDEPTNMMDDEEAEMYLNSIQDHHNNIEFEPNQ